MQGRHMTQPDTQALPPGNNTDVSRADTTIRLLATLIARHAVGELQAEGGTKHEEYDDDSQDGPSGETSDC